MGDLKPIIDVEMNNAIRELKKLWETSEIDGTGVCINIGKAIPNCNRFKIFINSFGIWCSLEYYSNEYIWLDSSVSVSEARKRFGDDISFVLPDAHFKTVFLTFFPVIKEEIEKKIREAKENKSQGMLLIDDVLNEFSVPTEEEQVSNDIKITVIDFGYRTVEIVNNGCFILDDKRPEQRVGEESKKRERDKMEFLMLQKMADSLFNNNRKNPKKYKKINKISNW